MDIQAEQLNYLYMPDTPFEQLALNGIDVRFSDRQWTTVLGRTGSGKSTFVQHLNGLVKPTGGALSLKGMRITRATKQRTLVPLRKKVGMVFQFPEQQLFAEEVLEDVMYGPLNVGYTKAEARELAIHALSVTGMDEALFHRSPFELSGGQMRRVAIAGIMAMDPELLILDEPTAGLDPESHRSMMAMFYDWYQAKEERGVVLVTHQMQDAAAFSDEILVLHQGALVLKGSPQTVFARDDVLKRCSLTPPIGTRLVKAAAEKFGMPDQSTQLSLTPTDTADAILALLNKRAEGTKYDV
ncbi:energy-coupling factor transporter ATPase [Salisediminibacterium beveridgei]|uniref:Energy-coupling factor transporter ATP-binding protein EcfA2 n=1 Tax=Salisediminibacterium beveridgei TaxID=632773 RepID=A0A1D7QZT9_9BACI|nr:energy-coupling factor transporter ATPase [Salisediminibacterium beveridgei]AOM84531.1 ATPase component of general energizing module of ECF transporter, Ecf ATPase 2 [Salisediminibacterium beveridgei]